MIDDDLLIELHGKADSYLDMLTLATAKTEDAGKKIPHIIDEVAKKTKDSMDKVGDSTKGFGDNLQKVGSRLKQVREDLTRISTDIEKLNSGQKLSTILELSDQNTKIFQAAGQIADLGVSVLAVAGSMAQYVTVAGLATAATVGLGVAIAGVLGYGAYKASQYLSGTTDALKDLNEAQKVSSDLNRQWADNYVKSTRDVLIELKSIPDKEERANALSAGINDAKKEVDSYSKSLRGAKNNAYDLSHESFLTFTLGNKVIDGANLEVKEHENRLELAKKKVNQLEQAYREVVPISAVFNLNAVKATDELTKKLTEENATIGMTAREIDIYKVKLSGASEAILVATRNLQYLNEELKKSAETANKLKSLTAQIDAKRVDVSTEFKIQGLTEFEKSLKIVEPEIAILKENLEELKDSAVLDIDVKSLRKNLLIAEAEVQDFQAQLLTNAAKSILGAQVNAVGDKLLQSMERLSELKQKLKVYDDTKKTIESIRVQISIAEAYKISAKYASEYLKQQEKQNELLDKGKDITKQFLTPFEQYAIMMKELNELLRAGTISEFTYSRAVKDTNEKLGTAADRANSAWDALSKLNSVKFGSVEAKDRIEDFNNKMKQQIEDWKKAQKALEDLNKKVTPKDKAIEKLAEDNVRNLLKKFDKFPIPIAPEPRDITRRAPMPREIINLIPKNPDAMLEDRKEGVRLLKDIDNTLAIISNKPITQLGVVAINNG